MTWGFLHSTHDALVSGNYLRLAHWCGVRVNGVDPYILADELVVTCDHRSPDGQIKGDDGPSLRLIIPKGFRYDGASIPRWLWDRLPRDDSRIIFAATVHDYLYVHRLFDRKTCDAIFLEIMEQEGMPWLYRKAAYRAVRAFGRWAWEDDD